MTSDPHADACRELVFTALFNATVNGCTFDNLLSSEIALDLKSCDADLEKYPLHEIRVHVIEWQYRLSKSRPISGLNPT